MGLLWVYYSLGGPQAKLFYSSLRINGGSSYSLNDEGDRFQVMVLELFLQEAKFLLGPVLYGLRKSKQSCRLQALLWSKHRADGA